MLRDDKTFSSSINAEHIGQFMGDLILAMNGEEHRDLPQPRRQGVPRVAARALGRDARAADHRPPPRRDRAARARRSRRVGHVGVPGAGDLRDRGRAARGRRRSSRSGPSRSTPGRWSPERGMAAARRWSTTCGRSSRRAATTRRATSSPTSCTRRSTASTLTDGKIYGFLRLLLARGRRDDVPRDGQRLLALLSHPDELARVYADRELVPEVIEETLRWETSVTLVSRVATADTEVVGLPDRGRLAGRGDHRLGEPRRDALGRRATSGSSAGRCSTTSRSAPVRTSASGMHLARLELRVGLNGILDRLPNLRFDPDGDRRRP